jgi:MFS family permease
MPVYLPSLLMSMSQMALLILLPLHIVDLGHSPAVAALIVGLRGVGLLALDVPAGLLVARFGDRPVLLGGLLLILLGSLLLAISSSLLLVSTAALLIGAGFAAWMLGRQSYIADVCANHEVGRAIAVMAGLQRVGIFIGPALGALLAQAYGYGAMFSVSALIAAVAGVLVCMFTRAVEHDPAAEPAGAGEMLALLRSQGATFAAAGGAAFSLQLMRATRQLLIPLFGQAVGLDIVTIGVIYSLSAGIDMCLFYPVGLLVDRKGRKWSAVPSILLFAIGIGLLPFAAGFASLLAVSLLLGIANGLGTGIVMIIGSDLAQASGRRGQFLGLWRLVGDLGMSGAPLLTAVLTQIATLAAASFVVAGAGLAGAVVMLLLVPETLRKHSVDPGQGPPAG